VNRVKVIAEIGQNHNGDFGAAQEMVIRSIEAGADYVKFQKRTLPDAIPERQRAEIRDTPWGSIPYLEYRQHLELDWREIGVLAQLAEMNEIGWFVSVWDKTAVTEAIQNDSPILKIPSALCATFDFVRFVAEQAKRSGRGLILSTGMTSAEDAHASIKICQQIHGDPVVMHAHSAYPAPTDELNLRVIQTFRDKYLCQVGYSGHEWGVAPSVWAVLLGATWIERHVTLDRTLWGSDQLASLPFDAFGRLVAQIRSVDVALGDGEKRLWDTERPKRRTLRGDNG
jgi:N-acetylneuraminate synthase